MLEILYKSKNAVVAVKPAGVPSQSDASGDPDMLTLLREQLSSEDPREELYLVHRLDRAVGGVLVFAASSRAAAELSSAIAGGGIKKKYIAVVEGVAEECAELCDYLVKNPVLGKAFTASAKTPGAKRATLAYRRIAVREKEGRALSLLSVELGTGRFHQIRAQLSSHSLPIVGDAKYGARDRHCAVALFSSELQFPDGGREISVAALPDKSAYPWSLFGGFLV